MGGSEFQVRGAAMLNDRLENDVCRNAVHSSGMDDNRVLRVLINNQNNFGYTTDGIKSIVLLLLQRYIRSAAAYH